MQKHSTAKGRKGSTSTKRDPLAPYREQAEPIIRLYFNPSTPAFVRDLLSSWFTTLDNEFQVNYATSRAVAEVFLPLALQAAEREGRDVFSMRGGFYLSALQDAADCIETGIAVRREPTPRETLTRELERDAEAIAHLIGSAHFPPSLKHSLASDVLTFTDSMNEQPEVIKAQWPLAVLARMEGGE